MASALHIAVRFVHLLAMAVVLGGAAVAWDAFRSSPSNRVRDPASGALRLARRYEWGFWAAMGLLVVTGVGNLGALGPPGPGTGWGTVLTVKLLVVTAFVLGSFLRTLAVVELRRRATADGTDTAVGRRFCRRAYAATGWTLVAVVALAEVLAHG